MMLIFHSRYVVLYRALFYRTMILVSFLDLVGCEAFSRDELRAIQNARDVPNPVVPDVVAAPDDVPDRDAPGPISGACLTRSQSPNGGCISAVFPSIPAAVPSAASNGRSYLLALKRLEMPAGGFGNWDLIGFDLDKVCSVSAERPQRLSCSNPVGAFDGPQGRDNAFGSGFGIPLVLAEYFRDGIVNTSIDAERITPGVKITEWSGQDDSSVTVELVLLVQGRGSMGRATLAWDGTDTWDIEQSASYDMRGRALTSTTTAGIACGWLVARMPTVTQLYLPFRRATHRFTLRDLHLAGPIDPTRGGSVDVTGLTNISDFTADLPWIGLCPNNPLTSVDRDDALTALTRSLDMLPDLSVNPATPCTAASVGMRLELVPVQLGSTTTTAFANYQPCQP